MHASLLMGENSPIHVHIKMLYQNDGAIEIGINTNFLVRI